MRISERRPHRDVWKREIRDRSSTRWWRVLATPASRVGALCDQDLRTLSRDVTSTRVQNPAKCGLLCETSLHPVSNSNVKFSTEVPTKVQTLKSQAKLYRSSSNAGVPSTKTTECSWATSPRSSSDGAARHPRVRATSAKERERERERERGKRECPLSGVEYLVGHDHHHLEKKKKSRARARPQRLHTQKRSPTSTKVPKTNQVTAALRGGGTRSVD